MVVDSGEELQSNADCRVKASLPETESTWEMYYVRPTNNIRTMKKYLKYSPCM